MQITLDIPEELVLRLDLTQLPYILELGLREFHATPTSGFEGLTDVLERLAALPTPEEILALRPSEALQERIDTLLAKNRSEGLSPDEEQEWARYEYLEHLIRIAKTRAHQKVQAA